MAVIAFVQTVTTKIVTSGHMSRVLCYKKLRPGGTHEHTIFISDSA